MYVLNLCENHTMPVVQALARQSGQCDAVLGPGARERTRTTPTWLKITRPELTGVCVLLQVTCWQRRATP